MVLLYTVPSLSVLVFQLLANTRGSMFVLTSSVACAPTPVCLWCLLNGRHTEFMLYHNTVLVCKKKIHVVANNKRIVYNNHSLLLSRTKIATFLYSDKEQFVRKMSELTLNIETTVSYFDLNPFATFCQSKYQVP